MLKRVSFGMSAPSSPRGHAHFNYVILLLREVVSNKKLVDIFVKELYSLNASYTTVVAAIER
jgi:hypothetical protein